MGADIQGWVEIKRSDIAGWDGTIFVDKIVHRSYGMFASLFGIRNADEWGENGFAEVGRFRAIAPGRGEPPGLSWRYREDRDNYGGQVGETWILWSELAAVDWGMEGSEYIGEDGYVGEEPGPGRRRERRGDYLKGGWATLFTMMAALAEQFGAENVRLNVWFDMW
jgi:hypothetical protein